MSNFSLSSVAFPHQLDHTPATSHYFGNSSLISNRRFSFSKVPEPWSRFPWCCFSPTSHSVAHHWGPQKATTETWRVVCSLFCPNRKCLQLSWRVYSLLFSVEAKFPSHSSWGRAEAHPRERMSRDDWSSLRNDLVGTSLPVIHLGICAS